jgi:hypothetical protein
MSAATRGPQAGPADRKGYRYLPLALVDQLSVGRCWSVVLRFHQESHDLWHNRAEQAAEHATAALGGKS